MKFKNKTIWITGASSGIGKALALAFSNEGANIILSSRSEKKWHDVRNHCKNSNQVEVLPLDLSNSVSFEEIVNRR